MNSYTITNIMEAKPANIMRLIKIILHAAIMWLALAGLQTARPDSSSPLLAAYYDRYMAIVGETTLGWRGDEVPQALPVAAIQVGVGRNIWYTLEQNGTLKAWRDGFRKPSIITTNIARFAAGRTGVLAIARDKSLWWIASGGNAKTRIAENVAAAAVGDGANYYVTAEGALFVRGKAHRGQYGDGRLTATRDFVQTAANVTQITAHTGHAILLHKNGEVMGTGGNIYGPVGRHGLGDKADRWSRIMTGAAGIATGSLHTVAIARDGRLFAWGDEYGPEPVPVLDKVSAAAASASATVVIRTDGSLWQWRRGDKPRRIELPAQ